MVLCFRRSLNNSTIRLVEINGKWFIVYFSQYERKTMITAYDETEAPKPDNPLIVAESELPGEFTRHIRRRVFRESPAKEFELAFSG